MRTGDATKAGKQYVSELGRGLGSALPFLDPITKPKELAVKREGFKEVAQLMGVPKKGPWDDALGFAGDVLLDPGNLFLGGLFKNVLKAGKGAGKGLAKVADQFETGRKLLGTGDEIADSLGRLFIPTYKKPAKLVTEKQVYKDLVEYNRQLVIKEGQAFAKRLPDEKSFGEVTNWIESGGKTKIRKALLPVAKQMRNELLEVKKVEKARGILKKDIDFYFSHIKNTEGYNKFFQARPSKIKPGFTKQRKIKGMISEINEAMGKEFFIANPAVSITIRKLASKKAVSTHDYLKSIEEMFGVVGKKEKIIDGVRHVPFKPKGDLRFFPIETKAGKTVAGVTKKVKQYLLPEEVANDLEEMMGLFSRDKDMSKVFKMVDKVTSLWKQSVTAFFPAFHTRNAMSNVFVNYLAGVHSPADYKKALDIVTGGTGSIMVKGKKIAYKDILEIANKNGVLTRGFFNVDIGKQISREVGKEGFVRKALDTGRKVGSGVENNARMALFVNQLQKGVDSTKAAQTVKKYLFDYSDLTKFERDVMRRVFPFYTWTRKAVPLMAEQLVKKPKKFKPVIDLVHNFQSDDLTEEERGLIPDYIRNTFGVQMGRGEGGDPRFLAGIGLPIEALAKAGMTGETATQMLNPLLKIPLEKVTGTSLFTKKKIKEDPFFYKTTKIWGNFPILKQYLKAEETKNGWIVDPSRMFWLKSVVGRFISTGEHLTKEDREWYVKLVNALSGMKIYDVDMETQKYFKEKEAREEVLLPMKQKGDVASFEKYFVPKD